MSLHGLNGAISDWDVEVCAEAERLIQLGVPPWDAVIQARQRISARRKGKVEAASLADADRQTA